MKMRCARWANRDDVETTLVAMRSAMGPCLALMHLLLRQAGQKWDRKQQCFAVAGQAQDYRILSAPKLTMDIFQSLSTKFHEFLYPHGKHPKQLPNRPVGKQKALLHRTLPALTCKPTARAIAEPFRVNRNLKP